MGGLVVKQLLLQASQDENRARIVKQTSGIVSLHPFVLFFLFEILKLFACTVVG